MLRRVLRAHALAAPPTAAAAAAAAAHIDIDADADAEGTTGPRCTALASQLASLFAEAMLRAPPRAAVTSRPDRWIDR